MKPTADPSVSLLARLRHLGQQQRLPLDTMLLLYVQQGFLARLDASSETERFVLKGGLSLFARYRASAQPTQDLDLAAAHLPNTPEGVAQALTRILAVPYADGLAFGAAPLNVRVMQIESRYPGVSAQVTAQVGRARQVLPLDVSFGNVITPAPATLDFPRLLVPEAVQVSVYPLETVVAEKFATLVELGLLTTRMKDVYDLSIISAREALTWSSLHAAAGHSFAARGTPDGRTVLTTDFAADEMLAGRWRQFLRRTTLPAPAEFSETMQLLNPFLIAILPDGYGRDGRPGIRSSGSGNAGNPQARFESKIAERCRRSAPEHRLKRPVPGRGLRGTGRSTVHCVRPFRSGD